MAGYRKACTSEVNVIFRKDKAYAGFSKTVGTTAQNTVELWETYDPNLIKITDVELDDVSVLYQKIQSGVNISTTDVRKYLYACTGLFKMKVEIDLFVSPNYKISKDTEITPLSLYKMDPVAVPGNETTKAKYKEALMNVLFAIRYSRAENDAYHNQLKKTIKKTKSNWNYPPWMNGVTADKLDDILAAYDWFLYLKETEDQPLRFGTVTTQWKDMGGFRDFCFTPKLFDGEPGRIVRWVQNSAVADSILKMHMIPGTIGEVGSSFPYCKSMGIVTKSDLSVSEHPSMHDYIHIIGAFLGNPRSSNSRFVSGSIARRDVCFAAMCVMATASMQSGVQLADKESRIINKITAKALRVDESTAKQIPDVAELWIQTYNSDPSRIGAWIKSRLTSTVKPRLHSILEYLMVSHKDWIDVSSRDQASADTDTEQEN